MTDTGRTTPATDAVVRTVTGDVAPDTLGRTDYHEHLLMRTPLLRGDELDDVESSTAEATLLREAGIDALVDLTPIGLGRDPRGLAAIARRSGLTVVAATGIHQQAHYPPEHWVHRIADDVLVDLFTADLTSGCDAYDHSGPFHERTGVRAGVIKVGTGYWSISDLERRVLQAAAEAHRQTGVAVVCHLESGTAAHHVLDVLTEAGLPPDRLALAHLDRNPDPGLHADLTHEGVFVGYDGMARAKYYPDSTVLDCLLETARRGRPDRLLLGGDVARRTSFVAYGGLPGMAYLPATFVPRLEAQGGAELVAQLLVANPAALLAFRPGRDVRPGQRRRI